MKILLDNHIDSQRVALKRPLQVDHSSSFVVDLTKLGHVNDIKKDMYGKWVHSGSHTDVFKCWFDDENEIQIEKVATGATGKNIYYLRRLHSIHPSNSNFRRMIAFIFGKEWDI